MTYRRFTVTEVATGRVVGGVSAQSAEEAVYRLMGGEWGRDDYTATADPD